MADDSFSSLLPLIAETTEKLSSGNTQEASKAAKELKLNIDKSYERVKNVKGGNLTKNDQLLLIEQLTEIRKQKLISKEEIYQKNELRIVCIVFLSLTLFDECTNSERQRLKNIEENNKLLEELGLGQASTEVFGKRQRDEKPKEKPAKKVKKENAPTEPPRRSSRRVPTTEEDKKATREQLEYDMEKEARMKQQRRELEFKTREKDMSLLELIKSDPVDYIINGDRNPKVKKEEGDNDDDNDENDEETDAHDAEQLSAYLQSRAPVMRPTHIADEEDNTNSDETIDKFKERMESLQLRTIQSVTANRIHSMQYHPDKESELVFAGDKYGQLGILRYDTEEDTSQIWRLQPHANKYALSCIRFDVQNSRNAFTCSYDCSIRQLDFESGISSQVFRCNDSYDQETNRLVTHLDMSNQCPNLLHIADNGGGLSLKDTRTKDRGVRYILSSHKLGSVSINPANHHEICTASNDRSVSIWDLRVVKDYTKKLKPVVEEKGDLPYYDEIEDKGLVKDFTLGKAVTSAYYSPTGNSILSTSFDNTIRVFDNTLKQSYSIKHNNETGRWLSVFRMQWINPLPNAGIPITFISPSMKRSIEVWTKRDKSKPIVEYIDSNSITAVPAVVSAKPATDLDNISIAGGNGSGKVIIYK
ncbi:WD40 repeat-like protein [Wallemia mellicola]|uniref:DNA damage-binding protein CMR1 n=1 Tax=Wallemia mellicola TaxID=1708541 RepID=A0A4T0LVB1_9BASI|nr:hypothetical protein E3Q24_00827 [Wallemia mellicola]TIB90993.1 WD40 repeat-like protein [Wallemia mellicola]TIB92794.1 WD40 repeat-like protein [Wallemia mellicola]TIC04233.1 WD40 repeat-like protein [Wallemia mellicola]TIC44508.1 WD40 repeat-like protein [Wallemia mellicola]